MRKHFGYMISICILLAIGGIYFGYAYGQIDDPIAQERANSISAVAGELIVKFKTTEINLEKKSGMRSLSTMQDSQDFTTKETLPSENIVLIQLPTGADMSETIANLEQNPNVEYAQPNYMYQLLSDPPDDSYFSYQWGLYNYGQNIGGRIGNSGADVKRLAAMDIRSGDGNPNTTGTIVAILDVGMDVTQIDLVNQLWDGTNCLTDTGAYLGGCTGGYNAYNATWYPEIDPRITSPYYHHSTHVAGIIGAQMNNTRGIAGVNPNVRIMNIKIGQNGGVSSYAAIKGLLFAKENGARVANMSRGSTTMYGGSCIYGYDTTLYEAIRDFPGMVSIAGGNRRSEHTEDFGVTPADFTTDTSCRSGLSNAISVAGTSPRDTLYDRSPPTNGSDRGTRLSIGAPACAYSTMVGNGISNSCGTSMASPYVAGTISLVRSFRPELTPAQVKHIILSQGDSLDALSGMTLNNKRLNIFRALQYLTIKQIDSINVYHDTDKQQELMNSTYTSGSSLYFEWTPSSLSGDLETYGIQLLYSGSILHSEELADTGIVLNLSDDGIYEFSVWTIASGGTLTGEAINFFFGKDTQKPTAEITYTPDGDTITHLDVLAEITNTSESLTGLNASGYTFTGNGSFTFTFQDLAGNTGAVTATVTRIDKISPQAEVSYSVDSGYITSGNVIASLTGFTKSGVIITNNLGSNEYTFTGNGTFTFILQDLAGNTGAVTATVTRIDKISPTATIVYSPSGPTQQNVVGYITGFNETITGLNTTGYTFTGNGSFTFIFQDLAGNTGAVTATVTRIDRISPQAEVSYSVDSGHISSGNIIASLTNASEILTGRNATGYTFTGNGSFTFTFQDLAGNTGAVTATVTRIDKISPTFTGINSGSIYTTGIRISFEDNLSGCSGTINGSTYHSGTIITGNGTYTLLVTDVAGNTTGAIFSINRPNPFSFVTQTDKELSTSYQSEVLMMTGLITGSQITIVGGTYSINGGIFTSNTGAIFSGNTLQVKVISSSLYATKIDAMITIGNMITGSFSVITKSNPGGGGGGGGGGYTPLSSTCKSADIVCVNGIYQHKDGSNCISGDLGKSCILTGSLFGGAGASITGMLISHGGSSDTYSSDLIKAYLYAYKNNITTMPTIQQADMTGHLIRSHLAKMISNFAIHILQKVPDIGTPCTFHDIQDQTKELQTYIRTACQLGLMGWEADGKSTVENFSPTDTITRAQFGTVLSRLLYGSTYNNNDDILWYTKHLQALQKVGIMNNVSIPYASELRGYVMLMLMRSSDF